MGSANMMGKFTAILPVLRIKITGRCNRSCYFCHEEGGMKDIDDMLPDDKFFVCVTTLLRELGIKRVILTGGEPFINPHIESIIGGVNSIVQEISVTTNGAILKSVEEWKKLRKMGLKKVAISIHSASVNSLLLMERKRRSLDWGRKVLSNQFDNIANLLSAGVITKVNIVVHSDSDSTLNIFNKLRSFTGDGFEIRLLNNLSSIESSQVVISEICGKLGACEIGAYQRLLSSNVTRYFRLSDGFIFSIKTSFSYFLPRICSNCSIRNKCFEGFYGLRLEKRNGDYFVRLCIYKNSPDVLMKWDDFIRSEVIKDLNFLHL
jgi:molybdenum cofactor biosynthesis enzyme MoaA